MVIAEIAFVALRNYIRKGEDVAFTADQQA
jgi:hypothetical protein